MNYTGTIYRPPFEANSLLLQVTEGCSHNKCAFCYMYPDIPFRICPMEQIKKDIAEASTKWPNVERVFLENGDAFVLNADLLEEIAKEIHAKLSKVKTISMYASIQNIKSKSDEDLRRIQSLGINQLDIGVESGLDSTLAYMKKGYTSQEAITQLLRLNEAGIDYCLNIILGGGGKENYRENALETAKLINQTQPYMIFMGTLHANKGCELFEDMQSG
ncbi:MAG: radical SAM protein [Solobacterium sp.]|nr:radical SAM protein [Solobacterium sp.]